MPGGSVSAARQLVDAFPALVVERGVAVDEMTLRGPLADLLLQARRRGQLVAAVQVDAENVHAGARQLQRGGLAESAAGAQNQRPRLFVHSVTSNLSSISRSSSPSDADADLGALRRQQLREALAPFDQHQRVAIEDLFQPQRRHFARLVQAVQVDMIDAAARRIRGSA